MKKRLLSLTAVLLSTAMMTPTAAWAASSSPQTAIQPDLTYNESGRLDISRTMNDLNQLRPKWSLEKSEPDTEFITLWDTLQKNGGVYIDTNGHIALNYDVIGPEKNLTAFQTLADVIPIWNHAIDLQLLGITSKTMDFYTPALTDEIIENISAQQQADPAEMYIDPVQNTAAAASSHCGLNTWNVGTTCSNNDKQIKDFYNSMLKSQMLNPTAGIDPWLTTAGYRVGLVRKKGAWDYKAVDKYKGKTFYCSYGGKKNQHRTPEWVGNYNYGYTGKFLFTLNVLHTGSLVVAKFDPKDKTTDWPAIDEGYNDAP